jgi:hypothetical protein
MLRLLLMAGLLVFSGAATAHDFAVGQVWTYHVRPGEEGSTLQINKIEEDPKLGQIFHISVFGVHLSNSRLSIALAPDLPHLPVSRQTLDESVVALSSNPYRPVAYEQGYAQWRQAFDSGHAGIYTISISDLLSVAEKTMARGAP